MEMWCPDDIGRDSWDWVGPPAWGRACFNSPEWGGGSSPVKTEPLQIVLLLLLLLLNDCVTQKEKLLSETLTFAIVSLIFVGKMCVVSRRMKIFTFPLKKNVTPQNGLLISS